MAQVFGTCIADIVDQEALHNYNKAETEHADLQSKLDTTQTELVRAQDRVEEHECQIHQFRRELAGAQALVEKAREDSRAAHLLRPVRHSRQNWFSIR